ncbi:Asp-tRNA(Asn)/Glu-tRNA(Gln) amidotransferase subunit GatB [Patescibacteria group bacterium]|nr:Asp-tRNA(Asn)/Glu-tRNA(Gln) amidotransferase subunit GatB [Patescibacteria group bacterium]
MKLQPVIGLEVHVQLKTKTKMFCRCDANAKQSTAPNTHVCPVCMGHPGVLPVPNEQAIHWAILLGLALEGTIAKTSKFDRKNYFYPDLPKAYQISQFDMPIMQDGRITLDVPGEGQVTIGIERLHLEEDAAKNIHGNDGKTYVDYNRGGTPLCEIVSRPHFRSAAQASTYLKELRSLVRSLDVSGGDMEKGQLRCDVNISLREIDENDEPLLDTLHPKTEIKNVNSFKAVERAIEYEIKRQTKLWKMATPPAVETTRGWNDAKGITEEQRTKENAADYRYFPEPDIPPMELSELKIEIEKTLPELPQAKRQRLMEEYGIKKEDAYLIVEDPVITAFAENALSELGCWLISMPDIQPEEMDEKRKQLMKLFTGWLLNKLTGLLADRKIDRKIMKITPENFAEFIILLAEGKLTGPSGTKVLEKMLDDGSDPSHAMENLGASRMDDVVALGEIIEIVIKNNPEEVKRYKSGDKKLQKFFVGQVMKESRGNADPALTAKILSEKLK